MCRRWAASERDSPWRSRSAASVCPSVRAEALSALVSADSTANLRAPLEQLSRFRRVREATAQLLQVALIGAAVVQSPCDLHAHGDRLEARRAGEAHVAQEVGFRFLERTALEGDHRE